jgi:hypothetical protein
MHNNYLERFASKYKFIILHNLAQHTNHYLAGGEEEWKMICVMFVIPDLLFSSWW